MKKKLSILLISLSTIGYSQKVTVNVNQIYYNVEKDIVAEKIINIDSTSVKELKNRFNNWGGTQFMNYEKVKTSETDNQLVIDYISSSFGVLDMYVRLTASFKAGKVRLQIHDMGNVYKFNSGNPALSIPARKYKIKSYFFKKNQITYKEGWSVIKKRQAKGALRYKSDILITIDDLSSYLITKTNTLTNENW